jgi:F0F1-type ATP synthase membrane subunit a
LLFGLSLISFIFYAFLHRLELFLSIIGFLELFSTYFQSITLSNRLSINIFAGSLIVGIIMTGVIGSGSSVIIDHSIVGIALFLFSFSLLLIIFGFEIFNTCIQFLLFGILMMSYSI